MLERRVYSSDMPDSEIVIAVILRVFTAKEFFVRWIKYSLSLTFIRICIYVIAKQ